MRSDWKAARTRLPVTWGALGTIVAGIMLARWTWLLFAPHAVSVIAPETQGHSDAAYNLFSADAAGSAASAGLAELHNIRLTGIFAGSPGFAVLELGNNKQIGVPMGGEVVHGVKLVEMAADHVVIAGNGIRQRINLQWGRGLQPAMQADNRRLTTSGAAH